MNQTFFSFFFFGNKNNKNKRRKKNFFSGLLTGADKTNKNLRFYLKTKKVCLRKTWLVVPLRVDSSNRLKQNIDSSISLIRGDPLSISLLQANKSCPRTNALTRTNTHIHTNTRTEHVLTHAHSPSIFLTHTLSIFLSHIHTQNTSTHTHTLFLLSLFCTRTLMHSPNKLSSLSWLLF